MPNTKKRKILYSQAINEALFQSMQNDKNVIIMGLGVDDPKRIFGTTNNLIEKFGNDRVFDMPTSENGMTGFAIGAALTKLRPVLCHQRVEFALLSMDQIINQAAKWYYMNAGQMSVPIVIRLIIGRGWGQGPQHSQSLENIFASIPGLKVVCPSNPKDAKGMLVSSIKDNNPVMFFEHRWLHNTHGYVDKNYYSTNINKCKVLKKGTDITIVSSSYMVLESIKAAEILSEINIKAEVIDLRTLRPLDIKSISKSVHKTKNLLVVDSGWMTYGISSEIITSIAEQNKFYDKKIKFKRVGLANTPIPSTRSLAKYIYPHSLTIVKSVSKILKKNVNGLLKKYKKYEPIDVPNENFKGPF
ncbi:alpha-ketoacid dehydrogenase subunit beta [Alphaproteobacteria bacterium]|nr:alpha-ketoacid dehydrogenase subunit beta [Alphaproteobacteria bacterium]